VSTETTTPTSVEELLRELERLLDTHAPALDAKFSVIGFGGEESPCLFMQTTVSVTAGLYCVNDQEDGQATAVLLDLLESRDYRPKVFRLIGLSPQPYRCEVYSNLTVVVETHGKTRSEAVARAVLAVLSQEVV
jgi:hypothetical protein